MRAAVALVLALCAALALRVRPADRQPPEHTHTDQGNTHCEHSPTIKIKYKHYGWDKYDSRHIGWAKGEHRVSIPYGSSLDVFCGCHSNKRQNNADKLTMKRSGEILATRKIYPNAIASTRTQDLLTSRDVFVCTHIESTSTSSMIISVTPAFQVISHQPGIYVDDDHINYTVQYGDPVTVLCSGPDAARLVMSQDGQPLLTELESNTTIKHKETDLLKSEYVCTDISTTYNSSVTIKVLPGVHIQSQNETITPESAHGRHQFYRWEYRNSDIEVNCFGPRTVKLIGHGDDNIPFTENFINVNPHGVKYINKLKIGEWYFECSESEFPDYVTRVRIIITPRMEVISPNIRRVKTKYDQYVIKYGDTIEIICSGTDSDELHIDTYYFNKLGLKNKFIEVSLNSTAIKYTLKEPVKDDTISFWCSKEGCLHCDASLSVGVLPADVTDFRCVSQDGRILNCTWTAPSNQVNFTLSYVENGIITRIYEKPRSSIKSNICVLDYNEELKSIKEFVLILQSCNSVGCSKQTFNIKHLSIVKPAPVLDLRLWGLIIHPRRAVITWRGNDINVANVHLSDSNNDFHHKVQYWHSGIEPREVNSSLIFCPFFCEIMLNMPCTWQVYEVRVIRKLKGTVGEEFWSEPRSVTFHIEVDVGDEGTNNDPACSWKPKKPSKTPAVMVYNVKEDKYKVHLKMQPLKEKVLSLKDKLNTTIRALKQQGKGTP